MEMNIKMALLLLFFLFPFPSNSSPPSHSHSDEVSLLAFKSSLSLDPLADWSSNLPFCNWTGVACSSRHHRVGSLNLTEYGMGAKISPKGDIYSYGILLLELFTRRRPTDNMFVEDINLPKWVKTHFPNMITEVVDSHLLKDVESDKATVLTCLTEIIQTGLICTREVPQERPTMMEVVKKLENLTNTLLGFPRNFHLPIDILPLIENTSNKRNVNAGSSGSWSTSTS